jgi:Na+/melibiose symporter-like transporter
LDVAGVVTALVFLSSLLLYANQGETWGWASPRSLALVGIAVVFGALFVWIERTSAQPMLNLTLYSNRTFRYASTSTLLSFVALYAIVFLTPFYLTFVLHFNILKVGLALIASPLATMFVAPVSGAMSDRFGSRGFRGSGNVYRCRGPLSHERLKCLGQCMGCGMAPGYHWHWAGHLSKPEQQ